MIVKHGRAFLSLFVVCAVSLWLGSGGVSAQKARSIALPPVRTPAPVLKAPAPVAPTIPQLAGSASRQKQDEGYTAKIREYTTEPFFLTELVDHLPASDRVPTPEKMLGYVAGAPGFLTYSADVHRYMRALEKATKRVRVFPIGQSEEGREMIVVAVSEEANLNRLARYKEITARLADPRRITDAEAERLIREGRAFYYVTGAMHSPETGSPEMLMELAYRLAVEETPFIQAIRRDVITLITPVLEVDGRDRVVDIHNYKKANPKAPPLRLVYWGKYVAHDNNRDGMALSLALTRNVMKTFVEYHPVVLHDLHESVPFLYTSTGTGPYNAWIDPILINEWHLLAYHEINELTKRGVPGVWTHGFYDGWAPNYMFYMANGHNAIGRFYETFGNGGSDTQDRTVGPQAQREWYRPNPPLSKVKWSLRNNVNLQQSALLLALHYVATRREEFLHNFYLKSKRSVAKATTEGPAAYVLPADEPRAGQAAELVRLLQRQQVEVHRADAEIVVAEGRFPAGSYVVRMDQPYSRMADMLLDTQYYNPGDPSPYDDTGWTLGLLKNVRTVRVADTSILRAPMTLLTEDPKPKGGALRLPGAVSDGSAPFGYAVAYTADCSLMSWRMRLKEVKMLAAEQPFRAMGRSYPAGSFLIPHAENPPDLHDLLAKAGQEFGVTAVEIGKAPQVKTHPLAVPRIALLHTWSFTQNEGWFRIGFEQWQVPYTYISEHVLRDTTDLRARFDVIVFPPAVSSAEAFIRGVTGDGPIPWKKTPQTPNLGGPDSSDDIRGGAGQKGVENLKQFVQEGGLFIAVQGTSNVPIGLEMAKGVTTTTATGLMARGSVLRAVVTDPASSLTYGYDSTLAVYFSGGPLFRIEGEKEIPTSVLGTTSDSSDAPRRGGPASRTGRPSGRGGLEDPDIVQARPAPKPENPAASDAQPSTPSAASVPPPSSTPAAVPIQGEKGGSGPRALLRFADAKSLLVSGMLAGSEILASRAAVIDVPYGKGHILLFAINPMWRSQTQGSYPLIFNAALHYNYLDAQRE